MNAHASGRAGATVLPRTCPSASSCFLRVATHHELSRRTRHARVCHVPTAVHVDVSWQGRRNVETMVERREPNPCIEFMQQQRPDQANLAMDGSWRPSTTLHEPCTKSDAWIHGGQDGGGMQVGGQCKVRCGMWKEEGWDGFEFGVHPRTDFFLLW